MQTERRKYKPKIGRKQIESSRTIKKKTTKMSAGSLKISIQLTNL